MKSMKSMNICGEYLIRKKKMGYIVYSKNINASHICPPKRNQLLNEENENRGFRENMDFDLQITFQSHYFEENMK